MMNPRQKKIKENWNKYHTPGCHAYVKRPINAIFISSSNSLTHEVTKASICYELRELNIPFITEACRNTPDKNGKTRRVDIVNLASGEELEVETDPKRAARFKGEPNVRVIKARELEEQNG